MKSVLSLIVSIIFVSSAASAFDVNSDAGPSNAPESAVAEQGASSAIEVLFAGQVCQYTGGSSSACYGKAVGAYCFNGSIHGSCVPVSGNSTSGYSCRCMQE